MSDYEGYGDYDSYEDSDSMQGNEEYKIDNLQLKQTVIPYFSHVIFS